MWNLLLMDYKTRILTFVLTSLFRRCHCEDGWTGKNCDTLYVPCQPSPCENGGVCSPIGNYQYNCSCPNGEYIHLCISPRRQHESPTVCLLISYFVKMSLVNCLHNSKHISHVCHENEMYSTAHVHKQIRLSKVSNHNTQTTITHV